MNNTRRYLILHATIQESNKYNTDLIITLFRSGIELLLINNH